MHTDGGGGWTRIVGIVGDVVNPYIQNLHVPQVYLPASQSPQARMIVVARTEDDPASGADALRGHVWALDPAQPVDKVRTFSEIHYDVNQRRREISVRMALGASAKDVLRLIVGAGAGAKLVFVGAAMGLLGAFLVNRILASVLFGVSSVDVTSLIAVPAVLVAVALTANYVPARRAARIDPMTSLRAD